MRLDNKAYDILKWLAQYFLPAIGTLYFALAQIWGFPFGEQVVGTITAVDAFLGAILGLSAASYAHSEKDGSITLVDDTSEIHVRLLRPDTLPSKRTVTLDVHQTTPSTEDWVMESRSDHVR